jgi:hypothetical protein
MRNMFIFYNNLYCYTLLYKLQVFSLSPHWFEIFAGFCIRAHMLMVRVHSKIEIMPLRGI